MKPSSSRSHIPKPRGYQTQDEPMDLTCVTKKSDDGGSSSQSMAVPSSHGLPMIGSVSGSASEQSEQWNMFQAMAMSGVQAQMAMAHEYMKWASSTALLDPSMRMQLMARWQQHAYAASHASLLNHYRDLREGGQDIVSQKGGNCSGKSAEKQSSTTSRVKDLPGPRSSRGKVPAQPKISDLLVCKKKGPDLPATISKHSDSPSKSVDMIPTHGSVDQHVESLLRAALERPLKDKCSSDKKSNGCGSGSDASICSMSPRPTSKETSASPRPKASSSPRSAYSPRISLSPRSCLSPRSRELSPSDTGLPTRPDPLLDSRRIWQPWGSESAARAMEELAKSASRKLENSTLPDLGQPAVKMPPSSKRKARPESTVTSDSPLKPAKKDKATKSRKGLDNVLQKLYSIHSKKSEPDSVQCSREETKMSNQCSEKQKDDQESSEASKYPKRDIPASTKEVRQSNKTLSNRVGIDSIADKLRKGPLPCIDGEIMKAVPEVVQEPKIDTNIDASISQKSVIQSCVQFHSVNEECVPDVSDNQDDVEDIASSSGYRPELCSSPTMMGDGHSPQVPFQMPSVLTSPTAHVLPVDSGDQDSIDQQAEDDDTSDQDKDCATLEVNDEEKQPISNSQSPPPKEFEVEGDNTENKNSTSEVKQLNIQTDTSNKNQCDFACKSPIDKQVHICDDPSACNKDSHNEVSAVSGPKPTLESVDREKINSVPKSKLRGPRCKRKVDPGVAYPVKNTEILNSKGEKSVLMVQMCRLPPNTKLHSFTLNEQNDVSKCSTCLLLTNYRLMMGREKKSKTTSEEIKAEKPQDFDVKSGIASIPPAPLVMLGDSSFKWLHSDEKPSAENLVKDELADQCPPVVIKGIEPFINTVKSDSNEVKRCHDEKINMAESEEKEANIKADSPPTKQPIKEKIALDEMEEVESLISSGKSDPFVLHLEFSEEETCPTLTFGDNEEMVFNTSSTSDSDIASKRRQTRGRAKYKQEKSKVESKQGKCGKKQKALKQNKAGESSDILHSVATDSKAKSIDQQKVSKKRKNTESTGKADINKVGALQVSPDCEEGQTKNISRKKDSLKTAGEIADDAVMVTPTKRKTRQDKQKSSTIDKGTLEKKSKKAKLDNKKEKDTDNVPVQPNILLHSSEDKSTVNKKPDSVKVPIKVKEAVAATKIPGKGKSGKAKKGKLDTDSEDGNVTNLKMHNNQRRKNEDNTTEKSDTEASDFEEPRMLRSTRSRTTTSSLKGKEDSVKNKPCTKHTSSDTEKSKTVSKDNKEPDITNQNKGLESKYQKQQKKSPFKKKKCISYDSDSSDCTESATTKNKSKVVAKDLSIELVSDESVEIIDLGWDEDISDGTINTIIEQQNKKEKSVKGTKSKQDDNNSGEENINADKLAVKEAHHSVKKDQQKSSRQKKDTKISNTAKTDTVQKASRKEPHQNQKSSDLKKILPKRNARGAKCGVGGTSTEDSESCIEEGTVVGNDKPTRKRAKRTGKSGQPDTDDTVLHIDKKDALGDKGNNVTESSMDKGTGSPVNVDESADVINTATKQKTKSSKLSPVSKELAIGGGRAKKRAAHDMKNDSNTDKSGGSNKSDESPKIPFKATKTAMTKSKKKTSESDTNDETNQKDDLIQSDQPREDDGEIQLFDKENSALMDTIHDMPTLCLEPSDILESQAPVESPKTDAALMESLTEIVPPVACPETPSVIQRPPPMQSVEAERESNNGTAIGQSHAAEETLSKLKAVLQADAGLGTKESNSSVEYQSMSGYSAAISTFEQDQNKLNSNSGNVPPGYQAQAQADYGPQLNPPHMLDSNSMPSEQWTNHDSYNCNNQWMNQTNYQNNLSASQQPVTVQNHVGGYNNMQQAWQRQQGGNYGQSQYQVNQQGGKPYPFQGQQWPGHPNTGYGPLHQKPENVPPHLSMQQQSGYQQCQWPAQEMHENQQGVPPSMNQPLSSGTSPKHIPDHSPHLRLQLSSPPMSTSSTSHTAGSEHVAQSGENHEDKLELFIANSPKKIEDLPELNNQLREHPIEKIENRSWQMPKPKSVVRKKIIFKSAMKSKQPSCQTVLDSCDTASQASVVSINSDHCVSYYKRKIEMSDLDKALCKKFKCRPLNVVIKPMTVVKKTSGRRRSPTKRTTSSDSDTSKHSNDVPSMLTSNANLEGPGAMAKTSPLACSPLNRAMVGSNTLSSGESQPSTPQFETGNSQVNAGGPAKPSVPVQGSQRYIDNVSDGSRNSSALSSLFNFCCDGDQQGKPADSPASNFSSSGNSSVPGSFDSTPGADRTQRGPKPYQDFTASGHMEEGMWQQGQAHNQVGYQMNQPDQSGHPRSQQQYASGYNQRGEYYTTGGSQQSQMPHYHQQQCYTYGQNSPRSAGSYQTPGHYNQGQNSYSVSQMSPRGYHQYTPNREFPCTSQPGGYPTQSQSGFNTYPYHADQRQTANATQGSYQAQRQISDTSSNAPSELSTDESAPSNRSTPSHSQQHVESLGGNNFTVPQNLDQSNMNDQQKFQEPVAKKGSISEAMPGLAGLLAEPSSSDPSENVCQTTPGPNSDDSKGKNAVTSMSALREALSSPPLFNRSSPSPQPMPPPTKPPQPQDDQQSKDSQKQKNFPLISSLISGNQNTSDYMASRNENSSNVARHQMRERAFSDGGYGYSGGNQSYMMGSSGSIEQPGNYQTSGSNTGTYPTQQQGGGHFSGYPQRRWTTDGESVSSCETSPSAKSLCSSPGTPEKKGKGRPKKPKPDSLVPPRPRGRPRKTVTQTDGTVVMRSQTGSISTQRSAQGMTTMPSQTNMIPTSSSTVTPGSQYTSEMPPPSMPYNNPQYDGRSSNPGLPTTNQGMRYPDTFCPQQHVHSLDHVGHLNQAHVQHMPTHSMYLGNPTSTQGSGYGVANQPMSMQYCPRPTGQQGDGHHPPINMGSQEEQEDMGSWLAASMGVNWSDNMY